MIQDKKLEFIRRGNLFKVILELLPVIILSYTSQILFKKGSSSFGALSFSVILDDPLNFLIKLVFNWQLLLGFLLAGLGALGYIIALSKNDFTVIFPILGALGFIVLPIISKFALNEEITPGRILGTVIIAIGMIIVALSNKP